jgi:hypothetical protein
MIGTWQKNVYNSKRLWDGMSPSQKFDSPNGEDAIYSHVQNDVCIYP